MTETLVGLGLDMSPLGLDRDFYEFYDELVNPLDSNPSSASLSVITGGIYQLAGLFIAKKAKSFDRLQKIGNVTKNVARNPDNAVKLNKQLGSQQQLGEIGVAGAGSKTPLRDSKRLANEYGGSTSNWSKRSSLKHTAPDGRKFETHWYENSVTGQRVEPKTIVEDYLKGPK